MLDRSDNFWLQQVRSDDQRAVSGRSLWSINRMNRRLRCCVGFSIWLLVLVAPVVGDDASKFEIADSDREHCRSDRSCVPQFRS